MSLVLGDLVTFLRLDKKKFEQGLDSAERQVKTFGTNVASSLGSAVNVAVGQFINQIGNSIASGLQNTAKSAFDSVSSFENLNLSLESLIARQLRAGDASISMSDALAAATPITKELLDWTRKLAVQSPYEDSDINRVIQLASSYRFGVQSAKELTKALVDAGAAGNATGAQLESATRALGQMQLKGKVSAEELNQLNEAGFAFDSTLQKMGVTLDDVARGSVSASEFIKNFIVQMGEESAGAADRTMTSWTGLFSTLTSALDTGWREFSTGLLEPLKPLLEALGEATQAEAFAESLRGLGEVISSFVAPAIEWLTGKIQALPAFFQQAAGFIQQFKDEMAGLTVGDIMAELPNTLANLDSQFQKTMDTLAKAHEGTIVKLQEQITKAGESLGTKLSEINEKYADKISDLHERMADTAAQFDERITEAAEDHAKKQKDIQENVVKARADLEEKLTSLTRDHQRRRHELSTSLLTAESEEQYLRIREQLRAEDERYNEEKGKAQKAGQEQLAELRAQLAEEDAEYTKAQSKLEQQRAKALADVQEQLNEVLAAKAKETAGAQAEYQQQVANLQARIDEENRLYADQVAEQKAMFEEQKAAAIESANARAAALGSGPAFELAQQVKAAIEIWGQFKAKIDEIWASLQPIFSAFKEGGFWAGMAAIGQWVTDRLNEVSAAIDVWVNDPANKEKFRNWGQQAGQALIDGIVFLLTGEGGPQIGGGLATALGNLKETIDNLTFNLALSFLIGFVLAVTNAENVQKLTDGIAQALRTASETAAKVLHEWSDQIAKFLADSAKSWGEAITSFDWGSVGSNITDGILGGLQASWGELTAWLSEKAASLPDWAQKPLGINSASTAFADRVGQWIPSGIKKGFEAGLPDLRSALAAGAASLVPASQPTGALAGAMGPNIYMEGSTFNLPAAPNGFDRTGLMRDIEKQQEEIVLRTFLKVLKG